MKELKYIELSGKQLPIRCSNFVLEQIQNKYKSLTVFEDLIFGRKGEERVEVNIGALNDLLVWSVKEGLELEAILKNKPAEEMTEKEIIFLIDKPPVALQVELVNEFVSAFAIKK